MSNPADQWGVAPTLCLCCTHQWVAVFPLSIEELYCPSCNSTDTETIRE